MTILETEVSVENTSELIKSYKEAIKDLEPGIEKTYLIHSKNNPQIWRIITIWKSDQDLENMRTCGTPKGVLPFQSVGSKPVLSIYEIDASNL